MILHHLLRVLAGLALLVSTALTLAVLQFGAVDEAIYALVPYVPIDAFQNFSSFYAETLTVKVLPTLRSFGLPPASIDCREAGDDSLWVIVAGPKGGTVLGARLGLDLGAACNLRVGIGKRPHGRWPTCEEMSPEYDSDVLLAIANYRKWPEYAANRSSIHKNQPTRCVVIVRNPFSRFKSLYQYIYDQGEYDLKEYSPRLRQFSTFDEGVDWMFDVVGKQMMIQGHEYLMASLARPECVGIKFEDFASNFDEAMSRWLDVWRVKREAKEEVMKVAFRHDLNRLTEEQKRMNHHVSGLQFSKEQSRDLSRAINANGKVFALLKQQAEELGYSSL